MSSTECPVSSGFSAEPGRSPSVQLLIIQGARITADSLRLVPMATLERQYLEETVPEIDPETLPPLVRSGLSPEAFSRRVADHYRAWQQLDPHPAKRMADEYGLKQATVHSWIREARLRGILPAAERRPRSEYLAIPVRSNDTSVPSPAPGAAGTSAE